MADRVVTLVQRRQVGGEGVYNATMAIAIDRAGADVRPLTVDEVIRMADLGIIGETERVELVDGVLVEMSPEGPDHAETASELITLLVRAYPEGFRVRSQSTLPLDERSYLEPDVFVVRPRARRSGWPGPGEVVLVVEVAYTSARRDREHKARLYAGWGAATYWVVDLDRREVVVHEGPGVDGYARVETHRAGDLPLPGADATIRVEDVLPPA